MKARLIKYPGRKWLKHESLWGEPELREYLPDTELFSPQAFIQMIKRYPVLFVKPDIGMQGQGVMKVTHEEDTYVIQTATQKLIYRDLKKAALKLKKLIGAESFLVQQGIDLIRINGSPVDFRALLHLRPNGKWRFFGIMGKVAAKNQFVTNHSSGGRPIRLHQALGIPKENGAQWDTHIKKFSILIADGMKKHFPKITELGLDIAIDTNRKIWLLEANTRPQFQLFKYHSDPRLFAQISYSVRMLRDTAD